VNTGSGLGLSRYPANYETPPKNLKSGVPSEIRKGNLHNASQTCHISLLLGVLSISDQ
jgi:hypothetical protein